MKIEGITLNQNQKKLILAFSDGGNFELNFEYLRVYSPSINTKKGTATPIAHKKLVMLSNIESVGKHGFRLLFDDQHSAIYSSQYLAQLCHEHEQRWQEYLSQLKASGHSREAIIGITQL